MRGWYGRKETILNIPFVSLNENIFSFLFGFVFIFYHVLFVCVVCFFVET